MNIKESISNCGLIFLVLFNKIYQTFSVPFYCCITIKLNILKISVEVELK